MSRGPETSSEKVRRKRYRVRRNKDHQPAWLWLVLLFVLAALTAAWASSCGRRQTAFSEVPLTAEHRTRLELPPMRETAYFTDRVGWLEENGKQVEKDLRYFYEKTGVQPHVYLRGASGERSTDRGEMDGYARALYGSLFTDESHLLILAEEQTDAAEPPRIGFAAGRAAASVMDEEALSILEAYWRIGFSAGEELTPSRKAAAAGDALRRTADNIMGVEHRSGWVIALIVLVSLLLLLAAREFQRNWNRLNKKEEKPADGNT